MKQCRMQCIIAHDILAKKLTISHNILMNDYKEQEECINIHTKDKVRGILFQIICQKYTLHVACTCI
jgi:hypothetical protein